MTNLSVCGRVESAKKARSVIFIDGLNIIVETKDANKTVVVFI